MKKKALCILLILLIALTALPLTVHAADYSVTLVTNGSGSVRIEPEEPEPNDTVTVYATADDGWVISKFTYENSNGEFGSVSYESSAWTEDFNEFAMPADNVTVTVDFVLSGSQPVKEYCTVDFDSNGGEGNMDSAVVQTNDAYPLPGCDFTKNGATFVKWYVDGEYYDPQAEVVISDDTTVKAIWLENGSTMIDDSVDFSDTTVIGKLAMTNTKTGETEESCIYEENTPSTFVNPMNSSVDELIEDAKGELTVAANQYSDVANIDLNVTNLMVTDFEDSRRFTYFENADTGRFLLIDGTYYKKWQYTVTLTADYTPVPMSYFSVWMSSKDQQINTGGAVLINYLLPDGTEPEDGFSYWEHSTNQMVPEGSQVTLTAQAYGYLGYRFVGWYQANINKANLDDPTYLADKLISTDKTYTFTDNPIGEGEAPYICAVFEDTGIIRQGDQIQVWITDGGKAAVEYTPSEPNIYDFDVKDGTNFVSVGEVVQYYPGDEITVHQQAEEGYVFKGWYHVWIDWGPGSEHPKYEGDVISTDPTFTYQPGVTVVEGDDDPLRYVCAVFEEASQDYILGDVDGNGIVESIDLTYLQRAIAGLETPFSEAELMRGDIDGNGVLEITDATDIQHYLANLKTKFPIGKANS